MNYFYLADIGTGKEVTLPDQEAHHAIHVLRLKVNDEITLLDGNGNKYEGILINASKKNVIVRIERRFHVEKTRPYFLHIAIAPVKSADRLDFFLEKATEIGVDKITLVITQNSERRKVNIEKLNQTLIASLKQSGNVYLPKLNEAISFDKFIRQQITFSGEKFICHCQPGEKQNLFKPGFKLKETLVLIGPEGDFTKEEVNLASGVNFIPITLGDERLRTETAGILFCSMIKTFHLIK